MSEYLSVEEAAEVLGVTTATIYKLINHKDEKKRLNPVNRSTYRGDGGYRFKEEDIEEIMPNYYKSDLTVAEAASKLGRSKSFIQKLIKEEKLPYYEDIHRGKLTYFIKEKDIEQYKGAILDQEKYLTLYDKKLGIYLFQPFVKRNENARIVEMKRLSKNKIKVQLLTSSNEKVLYEDAIKLGWTPVNNLSAKKLNSSYGYALFEFPIPLSIDSVIYIVIDELIKHIGPNNMKVQSTENRIIVEVKKSVLTGIKSSTHPDLIDKLNTYIKVGKVIQKFDGTLIDTGFSPITFYLPEDEKLELIRLAEKNGQTLQEWLTMRLKEDK